MSRLKWVIRALDVFTHLSGDVTVTRSGCHTVVRLSRCQAINSPQSIVQLGLPYVTPEAFSKPDSRGYKPLKMDARVYTAVSAVAEEESGLARAPW